MKASIQSLLFLLLFCSVISCKKDFLDVPNKNLVTRQDYIVDLKTTGDYLNGVYVMVSRDYYQGYTQVYPDLIADNIKPISATASFLVNQYNWTQSTDESSTNNNMNTAWSNGYKIIRACSFVIEKAEQYKAQNPAKADDLKGQAYAIRALMHLELSNIFAQPFNFTADASHPGIPFVNTYDWTQPVIRNTVAEVFTGIMDDITNAVSLLPAAPTNVNAANKTLVININAAKAIMARGFMSKGDYASAKVVAAEIGKKIPLMPSTGGYPAKLFTLQETEALFQLSPASTLVNSSTYSTNFQGRYLYSGASTQFFATRDIVILLNANTTDLRKAWIKNGGVGKDSIVKFPTNVVTGFGTTPIAISQSYYPTIIRSSEMYLIAAESYARLNNEDSARYYLNAIRSRANIPALPITVTGAVLLDSICLERRRELAFEGRRMFDLLRWKKEVTRTDFYNPTSKTLPYPSNKAIAPLPNREITITGLQQNPSYN